MFSTLVRSWVELCSGIAGRCFGLFGEVVGGVSGGGEGGAVGSRLY